MRINLLDFIPRKDEYYKKSNFKEGVRSLDIGLVRSYGKNPFNAFIKNNINKVTNGIFNHVFIVGKNSDVIEAEATGVKLNKITKYVKNDDAVVIYRLMEELSEEDRKKVLSFAYAQVGKKYDFWGIIKFLIPIIPQDNNSFFCSELVCQAYSKANIQLSSNCHTASPNDLWKYFSNNKNKWRIADYKNFNIERI